MFKVIRYFVDLEDNNHAYRVGDVYPREGKTVSRERINALLSGNNKRRVKCIEEDIKTISEPIEEAQNEDKAEVSENEEIKETVKPKASSKSKKKIKEG